MFSFAIYDGEKERLFVARDHLGQKPLYYYHQGDTFAFASEIKSLLVMESGLRELDCEALYEYLSIRIITPPRSMFRNIRKLPPGHCLIFQNGNITLKRYWRLKYQPKLKDDLPEVIEELEKQKEAIMENIANQQEQVRTQITKLDGILLVLNELDEEADNLIKADQGKEEE